jgi:hypothetical protein
MTKRFTVYLSKDNVPPVEIYSERNISFDDLGNITVGNYVFNQLSWAYVHISSDDDSGAVSGRYVNNYTTGVSDGEYSPSEVSYVGASPSSLYGVLN